MNLFSTHPPMDKRIAALARMESELQGTAGRAVPVAV
jgi:Zn-dependent protease with chaperone function